MLDSFNQQQNQQLFRQTQHQQQQYQEYYFHRNFNCLKSFKIMAGFRKRGRRTRTWFLLKDSVIFVIIMCVLQIYFQTFLLTINAELIHKDNNVKTFEGEENAALENKNNFQENLLQRETNLREVLENLTKDEFSVVNVNNIKIEEKIIFKTNFKKNLNKLDTNTKANDLEKKKAKTRTTDTTTKATATGTGTETVIQNVIFQNDKIIKNAKQAEYANELVAAGKQPTERLNVIKKSSKEKQNDSMENFHTAQVTTITNNETVATKTAIHSSLAGDRRDEESKGVNLFGIRENVMLPSEDPEREAQILYEKSLKEYHINNLDLSPSSGSSSSASEADHAETEDDLSAPQRTLHAVCDFWIQKHCHCMGILGRLNLNCRNIGILAVPVDLPSDTVILDLGSNNITKLDANSFFMATHLEELTLADNNLEILDPLAFYGLSKLKRLSLQNCGLKKLPPYAFQGLTNLISMQLNGNALASMDSNSLQHLPKLRTLRLEGNLFYRIPTKALAGLKTLEALNLGSNLLTIINDEDFPRMPNLVVLLLKRNQIMKISSGAFTNLTALKVLELDDNLISTLPEDLNKLHHLQEFSATSNRLRWINDTDLPKNLLTLDLRGNPLAQIVPGAFKGMTKLRKLILSDVRFLKKFPDLEGCFALEILKLDRAGISEVPANLCRQTPRLRSLELKTNSIQHIPILTNCRELRLLDLSSNLIADIKGRPFHGLKQLHDLLLSYNRIQIIPQDAFQGIAKLQLLDLEGNQISLIHKDAFLPFTSLEDLNLGNNIFPELPASGLQRLLHLKTFNNPNLKDFPSPETFPRIQTLILSYAYHCCPFIPLVAMSASKKPPLVQEAVLFPSDAEFDMSLWNNSMMDIWPQLREL